MYFLLINFFYGFSNHTVFMLYHFGPQLIVYQYEH